MGISNRALSDISGVNFIGDAIFGKPQQPAAPPPPPPPPPAPTAPVVPAGAVSKKPMGGDSSGAAGTMSGTILTSPQGLKSPAVTGQKTLLGQ